MAGLIKSWQEREGRGIIGIAVWWYRLKLGESGETRVNWNWTRVSGAGLLFNQVVRCMSHAVVSGSSNAVLSVLRRL